MGSKYEKMEKKYCIQGAKSIVCLDRIVIALAIESTQTMRKQRVMITKKSSQTSYAVLAAYFFFFLYFFFNNSTQAQVFPKDRTRY